MEKELTKVVFTFKDGKELVLKGQELESWELICSLKSDYLLPGDETNVLASTLNGILRGFVPRNALTKGT